MPGRNERVAGLLRREIANLLQRETLNEGLGLVSVTDVEVTRDLSHAKVFVSIYEIERAADIMRTLQAAAGRIRHDLAGRVRLRIVPTLKFLHDTSGETGQRIEQLLAAARKPRDD